MLPKFTVLVTAGDKRSDYGDFGVGTAEIAEWSAEEKVPGNDVWVARTLADTSMTAIAPPYLQGYTAMATLVDALKAAKSTEKAAVLHELDTLAFDTPYGTLRFGPSDAAKHQLLTEANMVIVQFTKDGEDVVLPASKASGPLVYSAP